MKEINPFQALDKIPYPLVIITAGDPEKPGRRGGMTAAWFTRVSWDPPLVAVSVAPSRYTYELIKEYKAFAVHVVSKDMEKLAIGVFGSKSGRNMDKFKAINMEPLKAKAVLAPIIPNAPVILECKVIAEYSAGDHVIFIGEVVAAYTGSTANPMVWLGNKGIEVK
ncbi:MAG: flavin reductase family protein [Desulfurococcaceae archaeon]